MNRIVSFVVLLLFPFFSLLSESSSLRIVSYNVENLFDTQHDTLKNDSSFLLEGMHHWTYRRYQTKIDRIAQVLVNIAGWESIPLVGLCEVENARCLRKLCYKTKCFHYKYIHYDSPDERGIDVAILYDSTQISILDSHAIPLVLDGDFSRDILHITALYLGTDTLDVMMCHLPSQLGGTGATAWKRTQAKALLQHQIDSILFSRPSANIVVMGDMNTHPQNDLQGMNNMMLDIHHQGLGTHKHEGIWSCIDQFYVSHTLVSRASATIFSPQWLLEEDVKYLGHRPKRTYVGFRYHDGYSDHLPIVLNILL